MASFHVETGQIIHLEWSPLNDELIRVEQTSFNWEIVTQNVVEWRSFDLRIRSVWKNDMFPWTNTQWWGVYQKNRIIPRQPVTQAIISCQSDKATQEITNKINKRRQSIDGTDPLPYKRIFAEKMRPPHCEIRKTTLTYPAEKRTITEKRRKQEQLENVVEKKKKENQAEDSGKMRAVRRDSMYLVYIESGNEFNQTPETSKNDGSDEIHENKSREENKVVLNVIVDRRSFSYVLVELRHPLQVRE